LQLKASLLAVLDGVRDESGKEAPVRLVFEPKSSRLAPADLIAPLLAHTSLETSVPINLTVVGRDGKPRPAVVCGRSLPIGSRSGRTRSCARSRQRLQQVLERIHILEGRQVVLLHIDEVIAIIRASDEPKQGLDGPLCADRAAGG
jgi:topoisomerase-4 subunit A